MAARSERFAAYVRPLMQNLKNLLDKVPMGKPPPPVRNAVENLKTKIDDFFHAGKGRLVVAAGRKLSPEETKIANLLVAEGKKVEALAESTADPWLWWRCPLHKEHGVVEMLARACREDCSRIILAR